MEAKTTSETFLKQSIFFLNGKDFIFLRLSVKSVKSVEYMVFKKV